MDQMRRFLCLMSALSVARVHVVSAVTTPAYTWRITVSNRSQDCYTRPVLLVNGAFQPTLEVTAGQQLEVRLQATSPPCSLIFDF